MHVCCIFGCRNEGVHLFPKEKELRTKWEALTRKTNFVAAHHSRLCADHFTPADYVKEGRYSGLPTKRRILTKGAVPSLFTFPQKDAEAKKKAENRCARRRLLPKGRKKKRELGNIHDCIEETEMETDEPIVPHEKITICSLAHIGTQTNCQLYTAEIFRNDNKGINFYTGLESFEKFELVFSTLCPEAYSLSQVINISAKDQFLLTLMKLRRNTENYELGRFFNVSTATASNIFTTWINFMQHMWEMLDGWPGRNVTDFYKPEDFEKCFPTTRVVKDWTDIPIQKSTSPAAQQATRSCTKVAVGAPPSELSQCSETNGVSTSDGQLVEHSRLQKSQKGDDDEKLSPERIHIERPIWSAKVYRILLCPLHSSYVPLASKIYLVCQMLNNFREGTAMRKEQSQENKVNQILVSTALMPLRRKPKQYAQRTSISQESSGQNLVVEPSEK